MKEDKIEIDLSKKLKFKFKLTNKELKQMYNKSVLNHEISFKEYKQNFLRMEKEGFMSPLGEK